MTKLRGNPWAALFVTCLGFFLTMLDTTIISIAIPDMMGPGLGASFNEILWVLNGYTLVLAALLITAGRLGDLRGARQLFIVGIAIFTVTSAACAVATTPGQLIGFRVAQGLGAALLMPQTLTIITHAFPAQRRGAALGIWGAVGAGATMIASIIGGALVTWWGWEGIFLFNVPFGLLTLVLAIWLLPNVAVSGKRPLDIPGVLLASAGLFAVSYGLLEGERYHWGTISGFISIPLVLAVGVALIGVFLLVQAKKQRQEPLVPFALFKDRNYTLMNIVSAMLPLALTGFFLPLGIYLQAVLGLSALLAGIAMGTMTIVMMVLVPLVGRFADRVDGKYPLIAGLLVFGVGAAWVLGIASTTSTWTSFLPALIVAGVGLGLMFAPLGALAMRDVSPRLAGAASGVLNTTRQIGMVVATAIIGALMQNRFAASINSEAAIAAQQLPPPAQGPFLAQFQQVAAAGLQVPPPAGGPPPDLPPDLAALLAKLGQQVFVNGFMGAFQPTMVLAIGAVVLTAIISLAVRRGRPAEGDATTGSDERSAAEVSAAHL